MAELELQPPGRAQRGEDEVTHSKKKKEEEEKNLTQARL